MNLKDFWEKHTSIGILLLVIVYFSVFVGFGALFGNVCIGNITPKEEQIRQYSHTAERIWYLGLKDVRLGNEKVEILSEYEIKVTEYGIGVTVDFSKEKEVISQIHKISGKSIGALLGGILGAVIYLILVIVAIW